VLNTELRIPVMQLRSVLIAAVTAGLVAFQPVLSCSSLAY